MELRIDELSLPLVHQFTIARESESVARSAVFRLRCDGFEGLGETAPSARYDESVASVRAYFATHPLASDDPFAHETLLRNIPPAARCGLDVALHDLIGKLLNRPLWQLLGLDPKGTPTTSFTIGLASIEETVEKLAEIGSHPIIKVKLGAGDDVERIATIRERYAGTIRVDANEAWLPEQAVATLCELERFDIEFCEQPIPAGTPEALRWIRERVGVPLVTDEDSQTAEDLPALAGCVDGVNVKLVKCGGVRAALAMIHTARALGLKIMLGCMVESAILATAAAQLSPLVDWADIDGPFLTAHDPFTGVSYDHGKLELPDAPGLGVRERTGGETVVRT
ncbi:MAG: dipeptide epimerase [Candidatus Eremiobacteraeota bacterium]|nr:dipeptide epimerase [Candidatus Eremiobacteraeota bacterium]